jgi:hypothetical protein
MKFKRGSIRDGGGISRLRVLVTWPISVDYDDTKDYDLEDPKSTNQKDPSRWREVNCPEEIEHWWWNIKTTSTSVMSNSSRL